MKMMRLLCSVFILCCTSTRNALGAVKYCPQKYTTISLANSQGLHNLIAIKFGGGMSTQSELVYHNPSSGALQLITGKPTGIYPQSTVNISPPQFCPGGEIFRADVNGDTRDDLLCWKSDDSFSVRKAQKTKHNFENEEEYAPGVKCDRATQMSRLLIGDFDGNKVDDVLCLDTAIGGFGTGHVSFVYFGSSCDPIIPSHYNLRPQLGKMSHHHFHAHGHYPHKKHECPIDLPGKVMLPDGFITDCDISTTAPANRMLAADTNGDGKDDLLCDDTIDTLKYVSSGSRDPTSLFPTTGTASATVSCYVDGVTEPYVTDVDNDGDDDLMCVSIDDADTEHQISLNVLGDYQAYVDPTVGDTIPCHLFCATTTNGGTDVKVVVGDFNADGMDDVACQYAHSNGNDIVTDIAYATETP